MHQWEFAWRDGTLTRRRWRPWALAAVGMAALAGLVTWGPFPVDMIGAGERAGNTSRPRSRCWHSPPRRPQQGSPAGRLLSGQAPRPDP